MKLTAISLVTVGFSVGAILPLSGADTPGRSPTPAAIIITNKTEGPGPARTPYLSAGLPEIVKMHKAGVDAAVVLAFVQNSPVAYRPSAKEIIYLRDEGISNEIISALLRRGGELRDRAAEAQREEKARATPPPTAPPAAPAPANPAPPQATAPTPAVAYVPYPVYASPSYVPSAAYYYSSPAYYSYYRPYYQSCYPYYSSYYRNCYPSVYAGYRWGCSPSYGLSVGYSGGRYSAWGAACYRGGYRYGGYGGYRYAGGGGYCRR